MLDAFTQHNHNDMLTEVGFEPVTPGPRLTAPNASHYFVPLCFSDVSVPSVRRDMLSSTLLDHWIRGSGGQGVSGSGGQRVSDKGFFPRKHILVSHEKDDNVGLFKVKLDFSGTLRRCSGAMMCR